MRVFIYFTLMSILAFMTGCATSGRQLLAERQDQNHSKSAAYAADGFMLDDRMPPERPEKVWQFYYKQCALVSRNPFPNHDEYFCTDPF